MNNILNNSKRKSYNKVLWSIGILLICISLLKYLFPKPDITRTINNIKEESAKKIDTINSRIVVEKKTFDSIQQLISSGKLEAANNLINPVLNKDARNRFYLVFKGQVYDANNQYDSALIEYNNAIEIDASPFALDKRAKTFIKLAKFEEAIIDYRNAFFRNYDYSYELARTFEKVKQKDSALKYYAIYSEHYPDSTIQKKIKSLIN